MEYGLLYSVFYIEQQKNSLKTKNWKKYKTSKNYYNPYMNFISAYNFYLFNYIQERIYGSTVVGLKRI